MAGYQIDMSWSSMCCLLQFIVGRGGGGGHLNYLWVVMWQTLLIITAKQTCARQLVTTSCHTTGTLSGLSTLHIAASAYHVVRTRPTGHDRFASLTERTPPCGLLGRIAFKMFYALKRNTHVGVHGFYKKHNQLQMSNTKSAPDGAAVFVSSHTCPQGTIP